MTEADIMKGLSWGFNLLGANYISWQLGCDRNRKTILAYAFSFSPVLLSTFSTAYNTVISPNFLVCKFCGNTVSADLRKIQRKLCGNFAFPQNLHTRKLGEISALSDSQKFVWLVFFVFMVSETYLGLVKGLW